MKTFFFSLLLFPLLSGLASAESFGLSLNGKSFTCSEGSGGGCYCAQHPSNNNYVAAFVGNVVVGEFSGNNYYGIRDCKAWIRNNPDICQ